jgi:hypothetical protein
MRNHSWLAAACVAAVVLVAGPARPQSPPPDALTAARELIVTMRSADQFKAILPVIVRNLKPAIVQGRPEVERDLDAILPLLLEAMSARVNEIVDQITALYARTFTVDELREVTAFYRGPTGQKFLEKVPAITQESMAIGQKFGQSVATEMQSRIIEELRKRGHKI